MHQFDYNRKDIIIKWSEPISIDKAKALSEDMCSNTYFYKIIAVHSQTYKLFYIGKCVKQAFTKRIFQRDHLYKRQAFKEDYKRHRIMVSLGDVVKLENSKNHDHDLSNIERLLIYSHSHDGYPLLSNKQNAWNHNVIDNYYIQNKGWLKDKMYKKLGYGLFFE